MSKKTTNIRVSRYGKKELAELPPEAFCASGDFPWEASVESDDGSWVLFIPKTGEPQLWIRVGSNDNGDGTGEDVYAPVGSEEHAAFLATG